MKVKQLRLKNPAHAKGRHLLVHSAGTVLFEETDGGMKAVPADLADRLARTHANEVEIVGPGEPGSAPVAEAAPPEDSGEASEDTPEETSEHEDSGEKKKSRSRK